MTRIKHNGFSAGWSRFYLVAVSVAALSVPTNVCAGIVGETGPSFALSAEEGYISVADGGSVYSWGYSSSGVMQLPGPTLIVTAGDTVEVTLTNNLPAAAGNVSIVFPGHSVLPCAAADVIGDACVTPTGVAGDLMREAPPGATVTYTFTATDPGTYQYHSGTQPDLQVEMGLYGAMVVRPSAPITVCATLAGQMAYDHPGACFDREYLYVLSEVDLDIHQAAELQSNGTGPIVLPAGSYHSEYWLMNGRAAPDTMAAAGTDVLPSQPYSSMTRMHPGERLLIRVVGAGREMHPFHHHGNHARVLARDGRMLLTDSGALAGPLLFTIPSMPGATADAIFEWTGRELGWDVYGHVASDGIDCTPDADGYHNVPSDDNYREWCGDHNKSIPVTLPALSSLAFGGFYSGSPYLGALGSLPPGEGGLNPDAGLAYMWHSHTERELVNNDVFPGGMMTMLIVEAPWVEIVD